MTAPLVVVDHVSKRFAPHLTLGDRLAAGLGAAVETRAVRALDDVSISLARGEALGLVGESGCGKTTLGRIVAGILAPTTGTVTLDGQPVMDRHGRKLTTRIQTVFQDPFASLDPRMRIGDILTEGPLAHGLVKRADVRSFVAHWLATVGLDPAFAPRFPHQFSGGQRQRVAIARALAMQPDVIVCDEPIASLDVSIQAQIINLFLKLRRDLNLTLLFISHDLGVVRHVCDRTAIMYLGRIVEIGPSRAVAAEPRHPYAQALMGAVPRLGAGRVAFEAIRGEIPSPLAPPGGCAFHPRCPRAFDACSLRMPVLHRLEADRQVACHLHVGRSAV